MYLKLVWFVSMSSSHVRISCSNGRFNWRARAPYTHNIRLSIPYLSYIIYQDWKIGIFTWYLWYFQDCVCVCFYRVWMEEQTVNQMDNLLLQLGDESASFIYLFIYFTHRFFDNFNLICIVYCYIYDRYRDSRTCSEE